MEEKPTSSVTPAQRLRELLPELEQLVAERLLIGGKASELLLDSSRRFGMALVGVYEFELLAELLAEVRWLGTVLAAHGEEPTALGRVLESWSVAISSRFSAEQARTLVGPIDAVRNIAGNTGRIPELPIGVESQLGPEAQALFVLVSQRRRRAAVELLQAWARHGRQFASIVEDSVLPVMAEVGRRWAHGQLGVADEHAATEVCRYAVLRLAETMSPVPNLDLRALVACVPGEEHSFGAEVLAEELRLQGWDVFFVGRSAPTDDIALAASGFGPDVVFLSVTMIANLIAARELAARLRQVGDKSRVPGVVLGGRAARLAAEKLAGQGVVVADSLARAHAAGLELAGRSRS